MDYKIAHIEALLQKYWQGETSRQEEDILKRFFTEGPVPPHLQSYVPIFAFFIQGQQQNICEKEFSKKIVSKIESRKATTLPKPRKIKYPLKNIFRLAAGFVLLATFFFLQPLSRKNKAASTQLSDTCESPQQAYQKAREALFIVSTQINKGYTNATDHITKAKSSIDF